MDFFGSTEDTGKDSQNNQILNDLSHLVNFRHTIYKNKGGGNLW